MKRLSPRPGPPGNRVSVAEVAAFQVVVVGAGLLNGMVGADGQIRGGGTERYLIRSLTVRGNELRASLCRDGWDDFDFDSQGRFVDAGAAIATRELVMHKGAASPTISGAAFHA